MNKRDIESYVLGGGKKLVGPDVASMVRSKRGRVITMRHVWQDSDDGRVSVAVWNAAREWAKQTADANNHHVEVYAKKGYLLVDIQPGEES